MQQLEEQEEGRMEIHGEFTSLQEEVDTKKKKLKKVNDSIGTVRHVPLAGLPPSLSSRTNSK